MDVAIGHDGLDATSQRYAFLVNSTNSLTDNLLPQVDDKPLARQRRRRTSPEDQAILEAEYRKNPKPDKAARMSIVQRVALGEKEVQIWFQNRRQSTRRKSRPLSPHEIALYQQSKTLPGSLESHSFSIHEQDASTASIDNSINDSFMSYDHDREMAKAVDEQAPTRRPLTETTANDRAASHDDGPSASGKLKRSRSSVRLSMGPDGTARITTGETPSPPRKRAPSVAETEETLSQTSFKSCLEAPDKYSGRAQDSRSWAVVIDKNARSQLEEHAKQERNGNAAGAIGLMRSHSNQRTLISASKKSSASKRGSLSREPSSSKRAITAARRTPLLQRSQSLQNQRLLSSGSTASPTASGKPSRSHNPSSASPRKFKKAASGLGIHLMSADADKENWAPDRIERIEDSASRTVAPSAVRLEPTPRAHTPAWNRQSASISRHRMMTSPVDGTHLHEDDYEDDGEVAYLMHGRVEGRDQSASSGGDEEEDLAGVQGLLSLSQGNWK